MGWIERAIFTDGPLVALLYRFFALEALLGDKSSGLKGEQLAFRRATFSHAVTGGFRHPETALWLYEEVRNNAVHGESMPDVDEEAADRFASDVHVDWLRHSGGPRWERFVAKQTTAGAAEAPP